MIIDSFSIIFDKYLNASLDTKSLTNISLFQHCAKSNKDSCGFVYYLQLFNKFGVDISVWLNIKEDDDFFETDFDYKLKFLRSSFVFSCPEELTDGLRLDFYNIKYNNSLEFNAKLVNNDKSLSLGEIHMIANSIIFNDNKLDMITLGEYSKMNMLGDYGKVF